MPITKIPEEMTFEEYQDLNRSLGLGIFIAALPLPGVVHLYANEERTSWLLLGVTAIGIINRSSGAVIEERGDFPDSDFEKMILNQGDEDREHRFKKIPVEITSTDTTFHLKELLKEENKTGTAVRHIENANIIGAFAYDRINGLLKI